MRPAIDKSNSVASRVVVSTLTPKRFVVALVAVLTVWTLFLLLAGGSEHHKWIAYERSPMRLAQTLLLVLASVAAGANAILGRRGSKQAKGKLLWVLLSIGFVGMALDERFEIHERIRRIGETSDVPLNEMVLLIYVFAGLLVLPLLWTVLRTDRWGLGLLMAGGLLAVLALAVDGPIVASASESSVQTFQVLEEILELAAFGCCFAAPVTCLLGRLSDESF